MRCISASAAELSLRPTTDSSDLLCDAYKLHLTMHPGARRGRLCRVYVRLDLERDSWRLFDYTWCSCGVDGPMCRGDFCQR